LGVLLSVEGYGLSILPPPVTAKPDGLSSAERFGGVRGASMERAASRQLLASKIMPSMIGTAFLRVVLLIETAPDDDDTRAEARRQRRR
jgi:hypothetical protein